MGLWSEDRRGGCPASPERNEFVWSEGQRGGCPASPERNEFDVFAAVIRFDLHVGESRSLKAKRAAIRPVIDGIRHRFRVSVAEVDHHDRWQRAAVGVAMVAESEHHVREVLDAVERFVVSRPDVELLDAQTTWLDPEAAAVGQWEPA